MSHTSAVQPVTYRPGASLRMATSLCICLVAGSVLGWLMTPAHIRALFTGVQLVTLVVFLIVTVVVAMSLGLSYVRADATGLRFRNGIRTYEVPWSQVKAIRYRDSDPWAYVLLRTEVDQRILLGIQRSDRDYAERCVADLRARLAAAYG